jgi:hypothetical protein
LDQQPPYGYGLAPQPAASTHAGQWGLASLLMGLVILLLVPLFFLVFLHLTTLIWDKAFFDSSSMKLTSLASTIIVLGLVGLGLFSFLFGIIGMVSAMVRGQPGGLAVAGSIVSLAALVLAIIVMMATFRLMNDLQKHVENRSQQKQGPPRGGP